MNTTDVKVIDSAIIEQKSVYTVYNILSARNQQDADRFLTLVEIIEPFVKSFIHFYGYKSQMNRLTLDLLATEGFSLTSLCLLLEGSNPQPICQTQSADEQNVLVTYEIGSIEILVRPVS